MLRSMTAFARYEHPSPWGILVWEVRSVNHRYLETNLRIPEALRNLETVVRERIGTVLSRGKVEAQLRLQANAAAPPAILLNVPLVERLLEAASEIEGLIGPGTGLTLIDVLHWPGVLIQPEPNMEEMRGPLLESLDRALAELIATREREGQRTGELLQQRCAAIRVQVSKARARRPEVLTRWRERLMTRINDLPVEVDPGRLEQELVLVAQRLDVDEELDRLDAHLDEIQAVFTRPEPAGRRLDFLMQELNREANTLSSKSGDTETTRAAVELKVLIEQMREQIQNLE